MILWELHEIDFEAPKLWKDRSGRTLASAGGHDRSVPVNDIHAAAATAAVRKESGPRSPFVKVGEPLAGDGGK